VVGSHPGNPAGPPGQIADAVAGHEAAGRRVLLLARTAEPLEGDRLPAGAEPAALAGVLVMLLAVPQARQVFALELPPVSVCAEVTGVVLAAITGLTLWRRARSRRAA
jgi:hypothetical protein